MSAQQPQYNPHNPYQNPHYNPYDASRTNNTANQSNAQTQQQNNPWYRKPTNQQHWTETSSAPLGIRPMSEAEIYSFRSVLATSYKITEAEMFIEFVAITNILDEDRDDCIYLLYSMDVFEEDGLPRRRGCFRMKIPIPKEMKDRRDAIIKQNNKALTVLPVNGKHQPVNQTLLTPIKTTVTSHSFTIPQPTHPRKPVDRFARKNQ